MYISLLNTLPVTLNNANLPIAKKKDTERAFQMIYNFLKAFSIDGENSV